MPETHCHKHLAVLELAHIEDVLAKYVGSG
jgi:hypothetical protein